MLKFIVVDIDDKICDVVDKIPGINQTDMIKQVQVEGKSDKKTIIAHADKLIEDGKINFRKTGKHVKYFSANHFSEDEILQNSIDESLSKIKTNLDDLEKNMQIYPYFMRERIQQELNHLSEHLSKSIESHETDYYRHNNPDFDVISTTSKKIMKSINSNYPKQYRKLRVIKDKMEQKLTCLNNDIEKLHVDRYKSKKTKEKDLIDQKICYIESKFNAEHVYFERLSTQLSSNKLENDFVDELYQKHVTEKPDTISKIYRSLESRNYVFASELTHLVIDMINYRCISYDRNTDHYEHLKSGNDVDSIHYWSSKISNEQKKIEKIDKDLKKILHDIDSNVALDEIALCYRKIYLPRQP